jgi:sigma-E factor negative regulatory protein RseB
VTSRLRTSRHLASVAVLIGLLGACAVLVVLVEVPGGSSPVRGGSSPARRPGPAVGERAQAAPATAPGATTAADRAGLRLMSEAATACQSVAFRGVQIAVWWGPAGTDASVIQVWHEPDGAILAEPASTAAEPGESQPGGAATGDQDEVMTVTEPLLALMRLNYVITYVGPSAVDGRAAQLVEVRRRNGSLAAKFWLDSATKLPLRRELFDSGAQIFSEDAFIGLSVGRARLGAMPAADAQPWSGQLTAAGAAALRGQGWPLPGATMDGLSLFKSAQTSTKSGKVVELSYSDGLSIISVFVQRGELPRSLPGWRRIAGHGGSVVYAIDSADRSLAWSAHGFVYTMISDAPASLVDQAVMRLPQDSSTGFWQRMGRGLRRIASWANPFR